VKDAAGQTVKVGDKVALVDERGRKPRLVLGKVTEVDIVLREGAEERGAGIKVLKGAETYRNGSQFVVYGRA
jgi:hypothetical protein